MNEGARSRSSMHDALNDKVDQLEEQVGEETGCSKGKMCEEDGLGRLTTRQTQALSTSGTRCRRSSTVAAESTLITDIREIQ